MFIVTQLFSYRHVILPPEMAKLVPRTHLMTETEWRNLGVQQSPGWVHYMVHNPGLNQSNTITFID
jgi:cyclin-dependent kinase regulatory subunit CKS1